MVSELSSFARTSSLALVSLILLAMTLAGCGGEPSECADVSCDFGVCEAGACVNPNSCETSYDCVPGYSCSTDGVCKASSTCASNADCASGTCRGGVCLSPESCETNDDCFERTYCADDNTCQPDPCNSFQCETGQCLRGTEQCVSKETCTEATAETDCINGDKCFEGTCYSEETFCDETSCERGECDFDSLSCANAESCSEDTECLDGFFCNDAGQCAEDLCAVNNVDCAGNGVCVSSLGACENANPCASNDDCIGGHLCVEGMCRLEETACGDAGCPGTQSCTYDADNLTATCEESGNCQTALGCKGDRQCAGGICLAPMFCEDDRFESNDSAEEATDFFRYASALTLNATVCSNDTDFFTVDTRAIPNAPLRGALIITAEYAPRDAGLGELELELIDPQGNSLPVETSGPMGREGIVEVRTSINAANHGVYTVRVAGVGQMNQAGVSYTLSADLQESNIAEACNAATMLAADTPINASTSDGTSYAIGSSCTAPHHPAQENIYQFELTETSRVKLTATPGSTNRELDLTMALRRSCERLATEMACANSSDAGGEVIEEVLPAGVYYAIVQVASGPTGGDYRLMMSVEPTSCAPAGNSCLDSNNAETCVDGNQLVTQTCQLGCNYRTGTCLTAEGDTCEQPLDLGGTDITETIRWSDFTNHIEMPTSSCVPGSFDTQTRGAEVVYAVPLEAGFGLSATLTFPDGEHGSLYALDGCFNTSASCLAGANDGSAQVETLNYVNESSDPSVVYLVADSAGGGQTEAELSVKIGEVICSPQTRMCDANGDVVECNGAGTAWQVVVDCRDYGCTAGQCNPQCTAGEILGCSTTLNATLEYCGSDERIAQFSCPGGGCSNDSCDNPQGDVCLDAIPAVNGTTYTGNFSSLSADYNPSAGTCPGESTWSISGRDIVFSVDVLAGQTIEATITSSYDTSIFMVSDCGDITNSCLIAAEDTYSGSETATYTSNTDQTIYVIPGAWSSSTSSGSFSVSINVY